MEKEYGPCVDGTDPTEVFICSEGPLPVGLIQIYRLADNVAYERAVGVDNAAGVDLFVADAARLGQGMGPRLIGQALELAWAHYPEVASAMAGPSVHNVRSHRPSRRPGSMPSARPRSPVRRTTSWSSSARALQERNELLAQPPEFSYAGFVNLGIVPGRVDHIVVIGQRRLGQVKGGQSLAEGRRSGP